MYFKQIFDKKLAQYAYIIGCQANGEAIVIDPMRDIDQYFDIAEKENLKIVAATDTHIHADYVSGLREFAERGIKVYASDEGDKDWKYEWLKDSEYHYELIKHGDKFNLGNIRFDVVHTPGHTPESVSFMVTDGAATDEPMGILTGDFVFVGDVGRPDLLETAAGQEGAMRPAAKALFDSVEKFKDLPDYLQVWPAHGSGSACGKALGAVPESTVGYETRFSQAFKASASEDQFIDFILDGQPEPPLYFGRMKKVNKVGPDVLGGLPQPDHVTVDEMINSNGVIVDTRERASFMHSHIPGSIFTGWDKNFNTIAGSYVDASKDLYLIIDKDRLEEALRDLIRVGLDRVKGYVSPETLEAESWEGPSSSIKTIDFKEMEDLREDEGKVVLDVRKATEYAEAHVPGAINYAHTRLAENLDKLPKDKELLVHCGSGQRASYATSLLLKEGFDLQYVDDHFSEWESEFGEKAEKKVMA